MKTEMKCLKEFRSKDPTRYYLNELQVTKDFVCSTDGHRAFFLNFNGGELAGKCCYFDIFENNMQLIEAKDFKSPNVMSFVPQYKKSDFNIVDVTLPKWFKYLKTKSWSGIGVTIDKDFNFLIGSNENKLISFNPSFLTPLVDFESVRIHFKDELTAFLVTPQKDFKEYTELPWFAVIMPMRSDNEKLLKLVNRRVEKKLERQQLNA